MHFKTYKVVLQQQYFFPVHRDPWFHLATNSNGVQDPVSSSDNKTMELRNQFRLNQFPDYLQQLPCENKSLLTATVVAV